MNDSLAEAVTLERVADVLVATVDNPPVNALSHPVRAGLVAALDRLEGEPGLKAMLLVCGGRTFMAGADIREFNTPMLEPTLGRVIDRLDACALPVVAAMHGTALGGGLEVALACSYRVALPSTTFGMPEVKLGLLPGAGGITRLPRLVGVPAALAMISEGNPVDAAKALADGLIDRIVDGDLRTEALAFTQRLVAEGKAVRRTSDLPPPPVDDAFLAGERAMLARRFRGLAAPQMAVDLIRMGLTTPFREATGREYAACRELVASPQSRALRHVFAAERAAARIDGVPAGTAPRPVQRVAVVGPGVMGRGIATCFLDIGLPVILIGRSQSSLDGAVATIRKSLDGQVAKGRLTRSGAADRLAALTPQIGYAGLDGVDLAVEAVTEDPDAKKEVFGRLDAALGGRAIMATNTSFLDIESLAAAVRHPADVAGMHFFNPANVMKLVEVVRAARTAPDVLVTLAALGRRMGKVAVTVGRSEGFVANRMLSKRTREAQFLLEEGATPGQVDRVLTGFGFPVGPFALADLAGMDVMAAARRSRLAAMTPRERACDIVDRLCAAGRLGQKSGAGYYAYGEDRKPVADPAVDGILAAHRAASGRPAREITDREILERCLYAMVNEAAKILDEGAAARPGDIDVIWTSGFGWPRHLGGPMFWADQIGLGEVKAALDRYSDLAGAEHFRPAALIERLAAAGRGFLD